MCVYVFKQFFGGAEKGFTLGLAPVCLWLRPCISYLGRMRHGFDKKKTHLQAVQLSTGGTPELHRAVRARAREGRAVLCRRVRGIRLPVLEAGQARLPFPVPEDPGLDAGRRLPAGLDDRPGVLRPAVPPVAERRVHVRVPHGVRRRRLRVHNRMRRERARCG